MQMFLAENDQITRNLIGEITALEKQYGELSAAREEKEQTQKQKVEKLNTNIVRMQEELRDLHGQKAQERSKISVIYSVVEELFHALRCSWDIPWCSYRPDYDRRLPQIGTGDRNVRNIW
jgi:predicted  nucleic acid-binding Zn-ribbon protein